MSQEQEVLLTQRELEGALGVTGMTIYLWRKGYAEMPPIPTRVQPRGTKGQGIRFPAAEVLVWLQENRPKLAPKFKEFLDDRLAKRTSERQNTVLESAS